VSIPVPLDRLTDEVRRRPFGYLVTVGDDQRPRAVALVPVIDEEGRFHLEVGERTQRNAVARPAVTMVFPPAEHDDHSLVVDGTLAVDTVTGTAVVLTPTWAVRHRPAPSVER
jgi:hypothetical protein